MKKLLLVVAGSALFFVAKAQCYKYVLFEHFTNTGCGPCAQQNPGFETNILTPNPQKVRHIAHHVNWPSSGDPMYTNNSGDNGGRTTFYSVNSVPVAKMNGNVKSGGPSSFSQADVDNESGKGSPIKINVSDVDNGAAHTVTIDVKTIGTLPSGSHNLVVALIEKVRTYVNAPGSNGEKHFPNVFLDMLTTGANGQAITLAPQGQSTTVTLTYSESQATITTLSNPAVNLNNVAVIAYVQNNSTKNVVQTGSSMDIPVNATIMQPAQIVQQGANATAATFSFQVGNASASSEQYTYTLTSTGAPSGWSSNFTVNSQTYTSTGTVAVPANTNYNATINVTPNASAGIGKYVLTITSVTNPTAPPMKMTVYVISGITDLIVNNTGGFGDASVSGTPALFEGQYVAGLQFANCTTYGITDVNVLERAIAEGAMGSVKNIYMNIAWSFPTFTDGLVAQLTTFLNTSGKCMFISGQDIAWDIMHTGAPTNTNSASVKAFFTNYMNATFSADGSTANSQLTANTADAVFGAIGNHAISGTVPYGSGFVFPDELGAGSNGQVIFKYNTGSKIGGVRSANGTYKVVYLGVGIEQLTNTASKNDIIKLSYDWFNGLTSSINFDQQMLALGLGQNYPNPSSSVTYIPMSNIEKDVTLQVVDLSGRIVMSKQIVKGTELYILNTETLETGLYLYRLTDNEKTIATKPMQVVR